VNPDLLDIEVRLLIVKYGRDRVLDALNRFEQSSLAEVESELRDREKKKRNGTSSKRAASASVPDLVAKLKLQDEARSSLVHQLAQMYETGRFLTSGSDIERFLAAAGVHQSKTSRKAALPLVIKVLASRQETELRTLLEAASQGSDKSDYFLLAHQIIGKQVK